MSVTVLVDIGGTHARFSLSGKNGPDTLWKCRAADYASFEEALQAYAAKTGLKEKGTLLIATAAYEDGPENCLPHEQTWRFVNRNLWVLDPANIRKQGWEVRLILNDFAAATWGLAGMKAADFDILKEGETRMAGLPRCLTGPGTGLGLGYLIPLEHGGFHVQRTHGGHVAAAALSDEQKLVLDLAARFKTDNTITVFENLASGPGLSVLHRSVCLMNGITLREERTEQLLARAGEETMKTALRLFHEFLGLFAHTAVVTGHAYGGLYLTGGVIEALAERDLFDFASFERFFILRGVASVRRDLEATRIARVKEPYPALRGLYYLNKKDERNI